MYDRKHPMNFNERNNCICMLEGCVNRICVSDDPLEIVGLVAGANKYLADLACSSLCCIHQKEKSDNA